MKDHSAEQRLRHYGPCYLAGAPASAGALPSKDRKNVQSAGLISGRSTEPAARAAKAFDRDIMALLLHRAINRDIAAGKFKKTKARQYKKIYLISPDVVLSFIFCQILTDLLGLASPNFAYFLFQQFGK